GQGARHDAALHRRVTVSRGAADPVTSEAPVRGDAPTSDDASVRRGTLYGAGAYLLWGTFPLYFRALLPASALEILLHRMIWSLAFCLVSLTLLHSFGWVRPLL